MKKLIFIALLILALVFTLAACSNTGNEGTTEEATTEEFIPEGDNYNAKVAQVQAEAEVARAQAALLVYAITKEVA